MKFITVRMMLNNLDQALMMLRQMRRHIEGCLGLAMVNTSAK